MLKSKLKFVFKCTLVTAPININYYDHGLCTIFYLLQVIDFITFPSSYISLFNFI